MVNDEVPKSEVTKVTQTNELAETNQKRTATLKLNRKLFPTSDNKGIERKKKA